MRGRGHMPAFLKNPFIPRQLRSRYRKSFFVDAHRRVATGGHRVDQQIVVTRSKLWIFYKHVGAEKRRFVVSEVATHSHIRQTRKRKREVIQTGQKRFVAD